MSISDTWSPLESDTLHSSSSATIEECEIASSDSLSSSTLIPSSSAISSSVGAVSALRDLARDQGMVTLRQDGWRKVQAGITTVEEVLRVAEA